MSAINDSVTFGPRNGRMIPRRYLVSHKVIKKPTKSFETKGPSELSSVSRIKFELYHQIDKSIAGLNDEVSILKWL